MALLPNEKLSARFFMRRYMERAEDNRADIHYQQFRPMNHLGKSPSAQWTADCSAFVTGVFRWADIQLPFKIHDPNGPKFNYNGYGFTGTLLAQNRDGRVPFDRKFFIGDMALYGPSLSNTKHVAICRKDGDVSSAIWTSHGSELGPYPVYLHYRPDCLIVVRALDLR